MTKRHYTIPAAGGATTKDNSMLYCLGSLLAFISFIAVIFCIIWTATWRQQETEDVISSKGWTMDEANNTTEEFHEQSKSGMLNETSTNRPYAIDGETKASEDDTTDEVSNPGVQNVNFSPQGCPKPPPCAKPDPVCESNACRTTATRVLALMNPNANPCLDMYEYSCGSLQDNRMLRELNAKEEVLERLIGQIDSIHENSSKPFQYWKHFFTSCKETDDLDFDFKRVRASESFLWVANRAKIGNLTALLSDLLLLGMMPLFDVDVEIETTSGGSAFVMSVLPPKLPTSRCDNLPEDLQLEHLDNEVMKYRACVENLYNITAIGNVSIIFGHNPSGLMKKLKRDLDFLQNATPTSRQIRDAVSLKKFNSISLEDFQKRYSCIDWERLFKSLTTQKASFPRVHIYLEEYFEQLCGHLNAYNNVQDSLLAIFSRSLYDKLVNTRRNGAKKCMSITSELIPDITSAVYITSFTAEELSKASTLIRSMFKAINQTTSNLWQNSCFDDKSKSVIFKKLASLKVIADGGLQVFSNNSFPEESMFFGLTDFITGSLEWTRRYIGRKYGRIDHSPKDPSHLWTYFLNVFDAKVKILPELNTIVVPYGHFAIQQLYDSPLFMQFGNLGLSIALEVARIFDPVGINFDDLGRFHEAGLADFQSGLAKYDATVDIFKHAYSFSRSHRLLDTYVNYIIKSSALLNDKFADDIALHLAFNAAKLSQDWQDLPYLNLNPKQLFFLASAQKFCRKNPALDLARFRMHGEKLPSFMRVNTAMANQKDFATAFQCSPAFLQNIFDCEGN